MLRPASPRLAILGGGLGVALTVSVPVHLASNLAGELWLDAITWLIAAATGAALATRLLRGPSATQWPSRNTDAEPVHP